MGVRKEHQRFSRQVTRTKRWKALRAEILERDGYRCRGCGCGGRLEVDHVKPVRTHPELSYDPGNLQALCPGCHTRKTRIELRTPFTEHFMKFITFCVSVPVLSENTKLT